MDVNLRDAAPNAVAAKIAALNVKRRLTELGHNMSLNHAYEALAAANGFPTWHVMKARLESGAAPVGRADVAPDVSPAFPEGIAWERLALGEFNPTVLLVGPDDDRRREIIWTLVRDWWSSQEDVARPSGVLHMVIFKSSKNPRLGELLWLNRFLRGPNKKPEETTVHRMSHDTKGLDIFNTPVGMRRPSERHRDRIVEFLRELVVGSSFVEARDVPRLDEALRCVVEGVYGKWADGHWGDCVKYIAGFAVVIDRYLMETGFKVDHTTTWFDVSDALAAQKAVDLSEWAHALAMPDINAFVSFVCRSDTVAANDVLLARLPSGETAADVLGRALSGAIRHHAFLRRNVGCPLSRRSPVNVTFITRSDDITLNRLMLLQTINRYEMQFDGIGGSGLASAGASSQVRSGASRSQLILVDVSDAEVKIAGTAMSRALLGGRECIAVTSDRDLASTLQNASSTLLVSGASSHQDVGALAANINIPTEMVDLVHDHMVGREVDQKGVAALVRRKMLHVSEWSSVSVPITTR